MPLNLQAFNEMTLFDDTIPPSERYRRLINTQIRISYTLKPLKDCIQDPPLNHTFPLSSDPPSITRHPISCPCQACYPKQDFVVFLPK